MRTVTVEGGSRFGIPIFGTMAHSDVQAHDDEEAAVEAIARFSCLGLEVPEADAAAGSFMLGVRFS